MLRRVMSAMSALAIAGLGVVGVRPQPAHAFIPGAQIFVSVAFNISATFNFGGSNADILRAIEQAKREIIAEIDASEKRIVEELNKSDAAHVAACLQGSGMRLRNMNSVPEHERGERINQANYASDCANQAGQLSHTVSTPWVADYLGYATAEANAIASVLRAWAGLDLESQLAGYISHFERLIGKLEPKCEVHTSWPGGIPDPEGEMHRTFTCRAYTGHFGRFTEIYQAGTLVTAPVDLEALRQQAGADTSWRVAREALPRLRQALAMVQRDFVVVASDADPLVRKTWYWHEDGPLSWNELDRSVTPTALASAIEPGGRRHYLAVMDGRVWHRMRNQDGSWGPWEDQGVTATAVSAAASAQGQVHVTAVIGGVIHHRARVGEGVWTDFAVPGGGQPGIATALASTVDPSGRLHLLGVMDGELWHRIRDSDGSWTPWGTSMGGSVTAVSAAAQADGQVHVAAVIDGKVYHRLRQGGGVWSGFAEVADLPATSRVKTVASAIDPAGNYQVAVTATLHGLDDVFLRTRFPSEGWSDRWVRLGVPEDQFLNLSAIAAS